MGEYLPDSGLVLKLSKKLNILISNSSSTDLLYSSKLRLFHMKQ